MKVTKIAALVFTVLAMGISANASAANDETPDVPTRASVCENETKAKTKRYIEKKEQECVTEKKVVTENRGKESPYRSENPNASCDLGLSFPSLPGFDLNIGDFNSCELLQDLTENVVEEVNNAAQETVDNASEDLLGDKDGIDMDLDANDYLKDQIDQKQK
ncbi:hypothetical protein [Vibrio owensii]|uniref:hypothetical protein n=1 Tax=Vibrio owensii TaxID=696485 RepID=UPI003CC580B6